jgi:hypothetical protein
MARGTQAPSKKQLAYSAACRLRPLRLADAFARLPNNAFKYCPV